MKIFERALIVVLSLTVWDQRSEIVIESHLRSICILLEPAHSPPLFLSHDSDFANHLNIIAKYLSEFGFASVLPHPTAMTSCLQCTVHWFHHYREAMLNVGLAA